MLIRKADYRTVVVVSAVRKDEAEATLDQIVGSHAEQGTTVCDVATEIRPLTDDEWVTLRDELCQNPDNEEEE